MLGLLAVAVPALLVAGLAGASLVARDDGRDTDTLVAASSGHGDSVRQPDEATLYRSAAPSDSETDSSTDPVAIPVPPTTPPATTAPPVTDPPVIEPRDDRADHGAAGRRVHHDPRQPVPGGGAADLQRGHLRPGTRPGDGRAHRGAADRRQRHRLPRPARPADVRHRRRRQLLPGRQRRLRDGDRARPGHLSQRRHVTGPEGHPGVVGAPAGRPPPLPRRPADVLWCCELLASMLPLPDRNRGGRRWGNGSSGSGCWLSSQAARREPAAEEEAIETSRPAPAELRLAVGRRVRRRLRPHPRMGSLRFAPVPVDPPAPRCRPECRQRPGDGVPGQRRRPAVDGRHPGRRQVHRRDARHHRRRRLHVHQGRRRRAASPTSPSSTRPRRSTATPSSCG